MSARVRHLPRALASKRATASRGHVQDRLRPAEEHHFLVASRQYSTSTCRMNLKSFPRPSTVNPALILYITSPAHRPGAAEKGAGWCPSVVELAVQALGRSQWAWPCSSPLCGQQVDRSRISHSEAPLLRYSTFEGARSFQHLPTNEAQNWATSGLSQLNLALRQTLSPPPPHCRAESTQAKSGCYRPHCVQHPSWRDSCRPCHLLLGCDGQSWAGQPSRLAQTGPVVSVCASLGSQHGNPSEVFFCSRESINGRPFFSHPQVL